MIGMEEDMSSLGLGLNGEVKKRTCSSLGWCFPRDSYSMSHLKEEASLDFDFGYCFDWKPYSDSLVRPLPSSLDYFYTVIISQSSSPINDEDVNIASQDKTREASMESRDTST